jgi:hypothetical protein
MRYRLEGPSFNKIKMTPTPPTQKAMGKPRTSRISNETKQSKDISPMSILYS